MSDHFSKDKLAEYAWGSLEANDRDRVAAHLTECRDCAWQVERCRTEARLLAQASEVTLPSGLAARILQETTAAPRTLPWFRFFVAAAAVLVFSVTMSAFVLRSQENRIRDLESQLARTTPVSRNTSAAADDLLADLCRMEVESSVADIVAWADIPESRSGAVRRTLLAASGTTIEVLDRASRGEIDLELLLTTDTLAGLDDELMAALDAKEYESVTARLKKSSADASAEASSRIVADLAQAAGLTPKQAEPLRAYLQLRCSWRRDFAFMPDVARREIMARLLGTEKGVRNEVKSLLSEDQAGRVAAFLGRESAARERMWNEVRKKS